MTTTPLTPMQVLHNDLVDITADRAELSAFNTGAATALGLHEYALAQNDSVAASNLQYYDITPDVAAAQHLAVSLIGILGQNGENAVDHVIFGN